MRILTVCVFATFALMAACNARRLTSAPPVEKTVPFTEKHPAVQTVFGDDVSISLVVTKKFKRDLNRSLAGEDTVDLLTRIKGSKAEGWFTLYAQNINNQGWAGTFSATTEGKKILKEGRYVLEGSAVIIAGTFNPDGSPVVKK
jgi:Cytochrome oxidase complex assembly protein 1